MGGGIDTYILTGTQELSVGTSAGAGRWFTVSSPSLTPASMPETLVYNDALGVDAPSVDYIYGFDLSDGDAVQYDDAFGMDVTFADDGFGNAQMSNGQGIFAVFVDTLVADVEAVFTYI